MQLLGVVSKYVNNYVLTKLDDTKSHNIYLPTLTSIDINQTFMIEYLSYVPTKTSDNIFKFAPSRDSNLLIISIALTKQTYRSIEFYAGSVYQFTVEFNEIDQKYDLLYQISFGKSESPNLAFHLLNQYPHQDLIIKGILDQINNVTMVSTQVAQGLTKYANEGIIGNNTLVTVNFSKYYIGEVDYEDH